MRLDSVLRNSTHAVSEDHQLGQALIEHAISRCLTSGADQYVESHGERWENVIPERLLVDAREELADCLAYTAAYCTRVGDPILLVRTYEHLVALDDLFRNTLRAPNQPAHTTKEG